MMHFGHRVAHLKEKSERNLNMMVSKSWNVLGPLFRRFPLDLCIKQMFVFLPSTMKQYETSPFREYVLNSFEIILNLHDKMIGFIDST